MGECNKETVFEILDYFYEKGGNFIDTANNYQDEQSEAWIGEWMEQRGVRDQMVLATKVSGSNGVSLGFLRKLTTLIVHESIPKWIRPKGNPEQLYREPYQVFGC